MATEQQIAANRANAQKSTGPKTPEGRAAVRLNSLKHGLSAETIVVKGEDPKQFEALWDSLLAEHQPATPTEEILVRQLAVAAWRQLRLFRTEGGFYRYSARRHAGDEDYTVLDKDSRLAFIAGQDAFNSNSLVNFRRFEGQLDRIIRGTIQELRRCRAERLAKDAKQTQSQPKPTPIATTELPEQLQTQPPATPPEADPLAPAA